ncbi:hypothetical protein JMN32_02370 [Fulvivirga sp. 29W222]|uniref:SGNH hydrolase-type esterase domain-containing protein n=1 Tax=Fulvivirga marina TaxID=2494733 RepID=A0A937FT49_9BACT|nr:GDSL-type esterase/lipase family protein [Fulvivirga marina]MBL6445135.1 hypothetical protein [Fulvivirga marina]
MRILTIGALIFYIFISPVLGQSKWEPEFRKFDEQDKLNPPPKEGTIIFTGSSSIRMWKDVASVLDNDNVINRGFGGSEFVDIIENFDRVLARYSPAQVVIYSGDNDITHGKTAVQVYGDFCTVYGMIKARFPETKVSVISIKPCPARWNKAREIEMANEMIKKYAETKSNLTFVDIYDSMLTSEGKPKPELYLEDGIHMTDAGYEIWRRAITPILTP